MLSSARRKPEVGKIYNIRTSWGRGVTVQGKVIEFVRVAITKKTLLIMWWLKKHLVIQ